MRFASYLSGDTLSYILGFFVYGWLVHVLTTSQYGLLSIATSVYQVLMMVSALGIDLIGPAILRDHSQDTWAVVRRFQKLRVLAATLVCLPALAGVAAYYFRTEHRTIVPLLFCSFSMILARSFDLSYVAVAFGLPGPLAKSRLIGLGSYLVMLLVLSRQVSTNLWLIPVLNALGVLIGRLELKRRLNSAVPGWNIVAASDNLRSGNLIASGVRASIGQLTMLAFQTLDVVYLSRYVSTGDLGQYAIAGRLFLLGSAGLTSCYYAFIPELLPLRSDAASFFRSFWRYMFVSCLIGIAGCFAFVFLGTPISQLLAHRRLPVTAAVSPWFGLAYLLLSLATPFFGISAAIGREGSYLISVMMGGLTMLIVDLLLVRRLGSTGAAIGQVAAIFSVLLVSSLLMAHFKWETHAIEHQELLA